MEVGGMGYEDILYRTFLDGFGRIVGELRGVLGGLGGCMSCNGVWL